ncbi:MAG TPA: VWA domain-containing protein [Pyrinomonadaceae bacterium]|jgi:Ca-activated chloride channel family protein|nr:VWA domain-containing protein [Pyrinomonadaceae bacterium]
MFYRFPSAAAAPRAPRLKNLKLFALLTLALVCAGSQAQVRVQGFEKVLDAASPVELRVKNRTGRVTVVAEDESKKVSIRATSAAGLPVTEKDVRVTQGGASVAIEVEREQAAAARADDGRKITLSAAQVERERIDIVVRVPARSRVFVETEAGAVDVVGNVEEAEAKTDTGTIRADVPMDDLRYSFRWTLSKPRFFSEVELPKVKIKRGGAAEISGRFPEKEKKGKKEKGESEGPDAAETDEPGAAEETKAAKPEPAPDAKAERERAEEAKRKKKEAERQARAERAEAKRAAQDLRVRLSLETARGVVLFGVKDESRVPSDLRERKLTDAARAIIRSGDVELIGAIRKVAPRLVGDYVETLPERSTSPVMGSRANPLEARASAGANLARVQARVTDKNGRAVAGLTAKDFTVTEDGTERAVREVRPVTAPFNLVLLLDVSGSVEERIDFIRKAALNFLNTASPQDRIAIVSFRDDVQLVSDFTTDRRLLTERIKDIQAGGATSLYDALGYSLVDTMRPLRGERTGVVILSDGDDNRSFLSFASILEIIYETGAIIYPLYIPSGLIPAASAPDATTTLDPTRTRYLELTSRADEEGRRLAEVSGGTYYPITRLEQLQRAYDDVAAQLRTAYTITYESAPAVRREARVRVRVAREGATVRLSPAVSVEASAAGGATAP